MQLRNAVEMAGMTEHCDFCEQVSMDTDDGRLRPDMVVNLPGGGRIPVDSKCVLDSYIDALDPAGDRAECMQRHASGMRTQMKNLASKEYWKQFERAPQIVVMFVPLESALSAALELDPNLHNDAMRSHVLIVSPTLLVALLRAVAYGWQQEDVAANARQIADTGRELYERIKTFAEAYGDVGRKLSSAVQSYNKSVGSIETRMIPSARKLKELHATTAEEIDAPPAIEIEARPLTAQELLPNFNGADD
jgi:DNA recombination protein RmuC